ncbi:MAG: carboxypeptidase-like regulatory domain-containing protein [Candidatus Anstonellaceae archaeon]
MQEKQDMRNLAMFGLCLLLLASWIYAGYTQRLLVQVFDQSLRPVSGAEVYVEHQVNSIIGYSKTKPKLTSENGTAEIVFTNWEELESQVKYTYTLYVKYGSELKTANLLVENPPKDRTYSMFVTAYFAVVHVRDQNGKPLAARVTIGNRTLMTDIGKDAVFQLPPGKYNVRAEVEGTVRNVDLVLDKDQSVVIEIPRYRLEVQVLDDFSRPLEAEVEIETQRKNTTEGIAKFENLTNEKPQLVVRYNQSFKRMMLNLKTDEKVQIVFDRTPPKIVDMHHSIQKSGETLVNVYVQEPGPKASGIASVVLYYEIRNVTSSVSAYTIGYNTFEAKIPPVPKDLAVRYTVKVTDREGNEGSASGVYIIPTEKKKEEKKKEEGLFGMNFGTEHYVGAFLALVLILYAISYYQKKKKEKELEKEMTEISSPPPS